MDCLKIKIVDIPEIPDAPNWLQSILSTVKSVTPWVAGIFAIDRIAGKIIKYLADGRESQVKALIKQGIEDSVKPDIKELTEGIKELRDSIWELKNKIK